MLLFFYEEDYEMKFCILKKVLSNISKQLFEGVYLALLLYSFFNLSYFQLPIHTNDCSAKQEREEHEKMLLF